MSIEMSIETRRSDSRGINLQSFGSSIAEGVKKFVVYVGRLSSDSLFFMRVCQFAVSLFSIAKHSTSHPTLFKVPIQKLSRTVVIVDIFSGFDPFAYFLSGKHIEKGASSVESLKQGAFLISGASGLVAFISELALQALKNVGETWISVAILAVRVASGFAIVGFVCSGYQAIKKIGAAKQSAAQIEHWSQLASNVSGVALGIFGVIGISSLAAVLVFGTLCSGFGIFNQLMAIRNKEQKIT